MPEFKFPPPTWKKIGPFVRKSVGFFDISWIVCTCLVFSNNLMCLCRIICRSKRDVSHTSIVVSSGGPAYAQRVTNCSFSRETVLQYLSYFGKNSIRWHLVGFFCALGNAEFMLCNVLWILWQCQGDSLSPRNGGVLRVCEMGGWKVRRWISHERRWGGVQILGGQGYAGRDAIEMFSTHRT